MHRLEEGRGLVPSAAPPEASPEARQRRRMLIALAVLLLALLLVVFRNRHVLYPSTGDSGHEATSEVTQTAEARPPQLSANPPGKPTAPPPSTKTNTHTRGAASAKTSAPPLVDPPAFTTTDRAVLPALQVEVVAGDKRHKIQAGSNAIKVDMQPGSEPDRAPSDSELASSPPAVNASERVRMSAEASGLVTHQVTPDYPLLAKQMKVQGAVILQAMIDREGAIQDLRVLSGPAILSAAAREAVRQWRFKPYYQSGQPVETQARITVNFTISTY